MAEMKRRSSPLLDPWVMILIFLMEIASDLVKGNPFIVKTLELLIVPYSTELYWF